MVNMATYLSTAVADYTAETLSFLPQDVMTEQGQKRQYYHEYDDGELEVVTTSNSFFDVSIKWDWISNGDADTLLSFYHDPLKANGKARSFYWDHPLDGETYVAKFTCDLIMTDVVEKPNAKEIGSVTMRINGVKA